jgi:hypothetical protein
MGTAAKMAPDYFGPLSSRYKDAYGIAAGMVAMGNMIKRVSMLAGGMALIVGLMCSGWFPLLIGAFIGLIVLGAGFISGTLLAAQGQLMNALLDTAVNTSPLLQVPEKASIMSL